jgi:hypothetical protein
VAGDEPPDEQEGAGTALVGTADGLTSQVTALHGTMNAGVYRPAGRHAFGPHAAIPYVHSAASVQPGDTYAAVVALSGDPHGVGALPQLTIEPAGAGHMTATITWLNGDQDQLTL